MKSLVHPPTQSVPHAVAQWFILKGDQRFGPFGLADLLRMRQQKALFPYDFIWHAGLAEWTRVAEVAELSAPSVRALFETSGEDGVFAVRQHARVRVELKLMIHDGQKLWRGMSFEISRGGVGLTMDNALIQPGQDVTMHFSAREGWPAFNARTEIVAKKFVGDDGPVEYGARFLSLNEGAREDLFKRVG